MFYCKGIQQLELSEELSKEHTLGMFSFPRQQKKLLAKPLASLAAEPQGTAVGEFAFPPAFLCLFITTMSLVSNALSSEQEALG